VEDVLSTVVGHAEGSVFAGGASAGACLVAAAALRLARESAAGPDGLVLAYGTFHASLPEISPSLASRVSGRHGLVQFRHGTVERMNRNYAGSAEAMGNPFAFPGGHDLTGLPPTLILDADRDTLRASGDQFARELVDAGVVVTSEIVDESTHGFFDRPAKPDFAVGIQLIVDWLDVQEERAPKARG
jgi:acetyl esterase/lipase